MRFRVLFSLGVVVLCSSSLALISAQEISPFTLYSTDPVVAHSSNAGDWDDRYTDPGAALYHDGQFHMFRNGFQAWPATVQIGYLTSPDGLEWTEVSEDPVLRTDDVPFAEVAALASSALVMEDGTWVLYFYTWNEGVPTQGEIGRATAADPLGPWTVDPEPVLSPGDAGSWDSLHVDAPSVLSTADGYVMYYTGIGEAGQQIGMATSDDGMVWTKREEPVLSSDRDNFRYHQPRVEQTEDGYVMVFRLAPVGGRDMGLGLATSTDGINWTVVTEEPFLRRASIPGVNGFWYTATAYHDNTLYLYIEGGRGRYTDIYAATATGPFGAAAD